MFRRAGASTRHRRASRASLLAVVAVTALAGGPAAQAGLLGSLTGTVTGTVTGLVGTTVGVVTTALDTTGGLLTGAGWGYAPSQTSMATVTGAIGADKLRGGGLTGAGVGVALVDTGVAPVPGLTSGNVVNGPDLSFESQASGLRNLDGFGHGTHLAGIIAGNDGTAGGFTGVAPGAKLVSIRAGSSSGAVDVTQVIAALDWAVAHRNDPGLNIRVLNLSFGTDGTQAYTSDPLARAVENAWKAGIVVVVAGGNSGANQPFLDNPATDPYVLSVGADDPNGTATGLDDTVPAFSSRGSATRHVDVVAPGQSIVSLRDPGSYVDTQYPGAEVGTRFFKGSGTSQAAAVAAGAVALLLQQRPSLTPDDVKALLTRTAQPVPGAGAADAGAGLMDVYAASITPRPYATQSWPSSTGLGTLQGARGTHVVSDNGTDLTGEQDIFGTPWQPSAWVAASTAGTAWVGGSWLGHPWAGGCWCGSSWTSTTWSTVPWTGVDWAGVSWSSRSWSGEAWSSRSWSGTGWVSRSWSSRSWSGAYWV